MLGKFFDKILHDEEELAYELKEEEKPRPRKFSKKDIIIGLLIFISALALRLLFLFFVANPQNAGDGWYGDVYHHWQIGFLTKEIGLSHSFLRLWDLKGMEYFWGPFHPLLLTLLFALTGSISIVIPRILSIAFGGLLLVLVYFVATKYWNRWVGMGAAFLGIVNPVAIFNDTSGMLEPIGYAFLLAGVLLVESAPLAAGFIWAISTLVRAESWLFSVFLIFVVIITRMLKRSGDAAKLILGFAIPMLLYMKYLLDHTGNAIYPFWWNYLANAKGVWAEGIYRPLSAYQLSVRPYLLVWGAISLALLLFTLWKKPKGGLMLSFGFVVWAFLGGFFGATHYLTGFETWFWYIRFFVFPYIFLGLLVSLFFFYIIPKVNRHLSHMVAYLGLALPILIIGVLIQLVWNPILSEYHKTDWVWERTLSWGKETGEFYKGGKVLIPEGYPSYTYSLAYYGHVQGKDILGQMFDPFYYMKPGYFDDWEKNRKVVLGWIKKEDIRLLVADTTVLHVGPTAIDNRRYLTLIQKEPQLFTKVGILGSGPGSTQEILGIYDVHPELIHLDED